MEYSKLKRGLEKSAGIIGVVYASIAIIGAAVLAGLGISLSGAFGGFGFIYKLYLGISLPLLALAIVDLIFCAKVIKTPVQPDGSVAKRTASRVCIIVFSFLNGNWIVFGLMLAVMCLKDFATQNEPVQNKVYVGQVQPQVNATQSQTMPQTNSFKAKIEELKALKDEGLIDDAMYKKAVEKILTEI